MKGVEDEQNEWKGRKQSEGQRLAAGGGLEKEAVSAYQHTQWDKNIKQFHTSSFSVFLGCHRRDVCCIDRGGSP